MRIMGPMAEGLVYINRNDFLLKVEPGIFGVNNDGI